jgi:four helix bundle protein
MYSKPLPKAPAADFRTFEDLQVYQRAREFRKAMYAVARGLPDCEKFGLAGQIRRAGVSLTNNIAEGHGRFHYLDQIRFTLQARGSLFELIDDLNVCADENYSPADAVLKLKQQASQVHQLVNGYIRYLRERKAGESLPLRESAAFNDFPDEDQMVAWQFDDLSHPRFNDFAI